MNAPPWLLMDLQAIQTPNNPDRGIARYVREQARAIEGVDRENEARFLYNPRLPAAERFDGFVSAARLARNEPAGPQGRPPGASPFVYYVGSPFEEHTSADDIWPRYARRPESLTAVTLYDLIPLRYPQAYLANESRRTAYETRLALVRNADLVLAISDSTARDAIELLGLAPERVVSIGAGVSDFWSPDSDVAAPFARLRARFPSLKRGYLLFTGGIDFRKNMEGTLRGYATLAPALRSVHPLVVTCKMDPEAERGLRSLASDLGVSKQVLFTNFVSDETLRDLYRATSLFIFPSLYEGFGLPLVEAMACGAPALGSDSSSMRDIVPLAEARFDPREPDSIGRTIEAALGNESLLARLRALGPDIARRHSWSAVAQRTLAACRAMRESAAPSRPRPRPRAATRRPAPFRPTLALWTPLPPAASGVADYSLRLVRALAEFADVDVFVEGSPRFHEPIGRRGAQILHRETFELLDALGRYDEVVYAMGNSAFHADALEMLRRRPGVVHAHEIRFTGLYSWYGAHRSVNPRSFADALRAAHPDAPAMLGARGSVTAEEADSHEIFLFSELLERSTKFLVHSRFAGEIVRASRPQFAERVREVLFGMDAPLLPEKTAGPGGSDPRPGPPVVATFGIVAPVKRVDGLLRAAPFVARRVPDVRFQIVGDVDPAYADELRALAASLGVRDRLELTGRVDPIEYERRLNAASCAVQLRASTNGESSAAIADCLRAAIPTIATDLGAVQEFSEDAVRRIATGANEEQLAAVIVEILTTPQVAHRFAKGGLAFARASSFRAAAKCFLRALFPEEEFTPE